MENDYDCEIGDTPYMDVLNGKDPQIPDDKEYMKAYMFWREIAGEQHFDPYYDSCDYDTDYGGL